MKSKVLSPALANAPSNAPNAKERGLGIDKIFPGKEKKVEHERKATVKVEKLVLIGIVK